LKTFVTSNGCGFESTSEAVRCPRLSAGRLSASHLPAVL